MIPLTEQRLPWLSAGRLPPRRKARRRQVRATALEISGHEDAKTTVQTETSSAVSVALPIIYGAQTIVSPTTSAAAAAAASPIPGPKAAPKSWSSLLQSASSSQSNGRPINGVRPNGIQPHSFTNLEDLLSRYNPHTHSVSPMIQPRGLINKGNMCFMNAILQVLVYCPPFYNLFDRIGKEVRQKIVSQTPLMDAMVMFIREFQLLSDLAAQSGQLGERFQQMALENIGEAFGPDNIYASMRKNSRFNSMQRGHQEDAEEFLGFLLDGLHEEFLESMKGLSLTHINGSDKPGSATTSEADTSDANWLEVGKKQKTAYTRTATIVESPMSRIFGGNMRSILRIGGSKDSVTLEPYQPLQLDIQSDHVKSITDALLQLPEPEVLSEDWTNGSGLKVRATKQVFIESLPPILILHLKRFLYDNVGGTQKSWKQVGYPLELEIPQQAISPGRRNMLKTEYKLIGVVYHHGLSATGGHYTVDVLRQDSKTWIHLDDTSILPVDAKDVAVEFLAEDNFQARRPNRLAYILLYAQLDI